MSRPPRVVTAVAGLAASLGASACAATPDQAGASGPADPSPALSAGQPLSTGQPSAGADHYRDGTYDVDGWYGGLPSRIGVHLTVKDGSVETADITTFATDPTSLDYQRRFAAQAPAQVVGRPLADLRVGLIAGASGCTEGFNSALERIRAAAAQP